MNGRRRQRSSDGDHRRAAGSLARDASRSVDDVSRQPREPTSAFLTFGHAFWSPGRWAAKPVAKWLIGGILAVVAAALVFEVVLDVFGGVDEVSGVTVVGQTLAPYTESMNDPAVGTAAPGFMATTFDGDEVSVQPGDGTSKVIGFYPHWCLRCRRELLRISNWMLRNGLPPGVEVLAVSTHVIPGRAGYPPSAWFERVNWLVVVLRDSDDNELGAAYGLTTVPYIVVMDGRGRVVARTSGELTNAQWEALLTTVAGPEA